jgi:hypothetical protein
MVGAPPDHGAIWGADPSSIDVTLTPGTRLGVYEVTAQIGQGGMGQVFRLTARS